MVFAAARSLVVSLLAATPLTLAAQPVGADPLPATVALARPENEGLTDASFPIVKEAYRRLGIDAEEAMLPGERALQALNSGQYFGDVIHAAGLEQNYPNLVRVPVPLLQIEAVVFSYGHALPVAGWAGLQPYRVCIRRGIKTIEWATAGMTNVLAVSQYELIFNMLKQGHCDVAVLARSAWLEAQRLQVKGLRTQAAPLQTWPSYHYVYKSHAGLVPALSEQLQKLRKSGYMARVEADYEQRLAAAASAGQAP